MKNMTCVIVDDLAATIENWRFILSFCDDISIVGVAQDYETGLEIIQTHQPDFVILDVHMPRGGGRLILKTMYEKRIYNKTQPIKAFLYTGRRDVFESMLGDETKYPSRVLEKGTYTIDEIQAIIHDDLKKWVEADQKAQTFTITGYRLSASDTFLFLANGTITHIFAKPDGFSKDKDAVKEITSGYTLGDYKKMIVEKPSEGFPLPQRFFFATRKFIINWLAIKNYNTSTGEIVFIDALQKQLKGQYFEIPTNDRPAFEAWLS